MMGSFGGDGGWFGFVDPLLVRKNRREEARKRRERTRVVAIGFLIENER